MKLLAISDIHGDWQFFRQYFAQYSKYFAANIDALVLAGDLTNVGVKEPSEVNEARESIKILSNMFKNVVINLGNHDIGLTFADFGDLNSNIHNACDGNGFDLLGMKWYGVGITTAYNKPELADIWTRTTTRPEVEKAEMQSIPDDTNVIISHCPPQGKLGSMFNGNYIGSQELTNHLKRRILVPSVCISGHVHQASGRQEKIGNTRCFNVAYLPTIIEL